MVASWAWPVGLCGLAGDAPRPADACDKFGMGGADLCDLVQRRSLLHTPERL